MKLQAFQVVDSSAGAIYDPTGGYRYLLWRTWDPAKPQVGFILLNPSTADAVRLDPTLTRCAQFSRRWGYGGMLVGNLFAYRSTNPAGLRLVDDPVGELNDRYLDAICTTSMRVVFGWGNHGVLRGRSADWLSTSGVEALCFGVTAKHQPVHPLYLRYSHPLKPFDVGTCT